MRRVIISANDGLKDNYNIAIAVAKRLQEKFTRYLVTYGNEITRIVSLVEYPELQKEFRYGFATHDVNMLKNDECYFFHLIWEDETADFLLKTIREVYDDHTHWRYFIVNADGNPTKTIAAILNYDYGPIVAQKHLPGETYEFIPL